jgi:hypothetical protein
VTRGLRFLENIFVLKDRREKNFTVITTMLITSLLLSIFLMPVNNVYSTTDDDEELNGTEEDTSDGQGDEVAVTIDPASLESLSVLSHRISTDEILDDPTMDIDGEIQNTGTEALDFVQVTATFYDQSNSILGSDYTYTEPSTLEPGQTAPFKVSAGFGDNLPVDDIASVKLHVDGD